MDQSLVVDARERYSKVSSGPERASNLHQRTPFPAIKHPKERMVADRIDGLRFARERGDVLVVRCLLDREDMEHLMADASAGNHALVEDVREWLRSAELDEAHRGKGACLVADHPFNVERLPRLDAIAMGQFPDFWA